MQDTENDKQDKKIVPVSQTSTQDPAYSTSTAPPESPSFPTTPAYPNLPASSTSPNPPSNVQKEKKIIPDTQTSTKDPAYSTSTAPPDSPDILGPKVYHQAINLKVLTSIMKIDRCYQQKI